ncbi:MAG: SIS domain-containing protein [Fusobacteriaceae bacterium]|nr:SIS domain-containing protein [Fusobacteriaceae bacterium]
MEFIKNYFSELKKVMDNVSIEDVKKVVDILYAAYKKDKQIFIIGNGGSASTASHFACDLSKGTLRKIYDNEEKRFRVISLTDNVALLTALGNDLGYDDSFAQQLQNLINTDDVVIAITGSGNSKNILNAIELASKRGATTIGFLGFDGGKLKGMVDHYIHILSNHYGRIEDMHLILEHLISSYLTEIKKNE